MRVGFLLLIICVIPSLWVSTHLHAAARYPVTALPIFLDLKVTSEILPAVTPVAEQNWWERLRSWLGARRAFRVQPPAGTVLVVEASAYASSPYQTDDTPCITAAGTTVRSGVVATNFLPLGTVLEINGQPYIVEDRMGQRYNGYYMDIWFPATSQALVFGRQKLKIRIVGYGTPGQDLTVRSSWTDTLGRWLRTAAGQDVNQYDVKCF